MDCLDLDAPAKFYAPDIGTLEVLEGFDDKGAPLLRPPRREITVRMLLTHTAGFGYDFFNALYWRLKSEHGQVNPRLGLKGGLMVPLLFDPGERWEYGLGVDWAGQVIEGAAGERLDAILEARVFEPLGMTETGFALTPDQRTRRASMHEFDADGVLKPVDFVLPEAPEVFMGGGALFGTAPDYMRFLRMWLNDGRRANSAAYCGPRPWNTRVRNHLGEIAVVRVAGDQSRGDASARILPGREEVLGAEFFAQRRGSADRPAGGRARLGGLRQPLLLARPRERTRWLLGGADVSVPARSAARRIFAFRDRGLSRVAIGNGARIGTSA